MHKDDRLSDCRRRYHEGHHCFRSKRRPPRKDLARRRPILVPDEYLGERNLDSLEDQIHGARQREEHLHFPEEPEACKRNLEVQTASRCSNQLWRGDYFCHRWIYQYAGRLERKRGARPQVLTGQPLTAITGRHTVHPNEEEEEWGKRISLFGSNRSRPLRKLARGGQLQGTCPISVNQEGNLLRVIAIEPRLHQTSLYNRLAANQGAET